MNHYLIIFAITLLASVGLVLTQRWHGRFSLDGTHGVQKFHTRPTPRIGGVAIAAGLMGTHYVTSDEVREILSPMLLAAIPAFGVGLLEDLTKKVGVFPRLLATMVSGVFAWYLTSVAMQNTGVTPLDWLLSFTPLAVLFTAFAVGGVANAVNIIDGFNGLASGAVAIMLGALALMALNLGDAPLATVCLALTVVTLGFAASNWPLGKIFLGDGGAYLLGFLLAWVAVLLPMRHPEINAWATMLVCAYPVLEVGFSYRRKSKRVGHSPGQPDKVHLHMLINRRIIRKVFPHFSPALQNGFTSPISWACTALPAAWAVYFAQSTPMLILGFVGVIFAYAAFYARLTQFCWCYSARTLSPLLVKVAP